MKVFFLLFEAGSILNSDWVAQDFVQSGFENHQRWRFRNLSGLPVAKCNYSHKLTFSLYIQLEPPLFQFVTSVSSSPAVHLNKEPRSIFSITSFLVLEIKTYVQYCEEM